MVYTALCPICGIYVNVEITQEEYMLYKKFGVLSRDFEERCICQCCKDDCNNSIE